MKRLKNGYYQVRLQVSPEIIRFAVREGSRFGIFGAEDYLNGILNTAMLREMEEEPLSPREIAARRKAAEESEDGFPF